MERFPPERVREILAGGAERARPMARAKLEQVRERIGLIHL
jgi:hypothetical protein